MTESLTTDAAREARRELGRRVRDRLVEGTLEPAHAGMYVESDPAQQVCRVCFVCALVVARYGDDELEKLDIDVESRPQWIARLLGDLFPLAELAVAELLFERGVTSRLSDLLREKDAILADQVEHEASERRSALPKERPLRMLTLASLLAETGGFGR